jgi:hypothetical protein
MYVRDPKRQKERRQGQIDAVNPTSKLAIHESASKKNGCDSVGPTSIKEGSQTARSEGQKMATANKSQEMK